MKIALVVHDFSRAVGHGRYAVELAQHFSAEHEVHIFANRIDAEALGGAHGHYVPAIRSNALASVLTFPVPATLRIGRDWDIVHAQGVTCGRFNVITAHICQAGWARAQQGAQVARTWRQRVFETVVTRLENVTYRRSQKARVIAISRRLRAELAEFYGRTAAVDVIHHGVDTEHFSPVTESGRQALRDDLGLPRSANVALFVGDLRKGAAVALDVIARTPDVHFVAVSRSDIAPYVARAEELGVSARVAFHPAVATIHRYYQAADFLLFPTPYDAFGMVISEAMACGIPVITPVQAGAAELLAHGESGFVVERADDVEAMAAHATRLASDATLRYTMGRAARATAERHTWAEVARATMAIYERAEPLR